jgi:Winged helix-turn helix
VVDRTPSRPLDPAHTGLQVHPQRGWEYLKRLGYSKRILRPPHAKADAMTQEAFKKPFHSV